MSHSVAKKTVAIRNPEGLHARPADMFVRLAKQFDADIQVAKDNEFVDGKSIIMILTLGLLGLVGFFLM